ncbi:MAG: hypothetical protein SVY15_06205 [Halobacteriota archaeon]|nr:hypothetical protein [Halobacteriota archaeon]
MRYNEVRGNKSKKVLSILLVGLMLLFIFAAMVPAVSAEYHGDHNLIIAGRTDNKVIRGQTLKFQTEN